VNDDERAWGQRRKRVLQLSDERHEGVQARLRLASSKTATAASNETVGKSFTKSSSDDAVSR
jgi:hypothetical protein